MTSSALSLVSGPPEISVTYKVSIASAPNVVTIAERISTFDCVIAAPILKSKPGRSWLLTSITVASVAASLK